MDSPWCLFDLAEIRLYQDSRANFLRFLEDGLLARGTRGWQAETFRKSLELLSAAEYKPPGLVDGIERLKRAETQLPKWGSLGAVPRASRSSTRSSGMVFRPAVQ